MLGHEPARARDAACGPVVAPGTPGHALLPRTHVQTRMVRMLARAAASYACTARGRAASEVLLRGDEDLTRRHNGDRQQPHLTQ